MSGATTVSNRSVVDPRAGRGPATSRAVITGASPTIANRRPPGLSCCDERVRQHRRRSGQHDRVVASRCPSRARRRRPRSSTSAKPCARELGARPRREPRVDLDARHVAPAAREQRGEVAAAGADLEHALAGRELAAPAARAPPSSAPTSLRRRPSGSSRSANASSRYSGGTKSSRRTVNRRSRTSWSSTSQVRICCSTMLKRACSMSIPMADCKCAGRQCGRHYRTPLRATPR